MRIKEVKGKINVDNKMDLYYDSLNLKVLFKLEKRQAEYIRPVFRQINKDYYILPTVASGYAKFGFYGRVAEIESGGIGVHKTHEFSIVVSDSKDRDKKSPNFPKIQIILEHFLDDRSDLNMELRGNSLTLKALIANPDQECFKGLPQVIKPIIEPDTDLSL